MQLTALRLPVYDPRPRSSTTVAGADHARYADPEARDSFLVLARDAFCACTLTGSITVWTEAAEQLSGYSAAEVVGRPFSSLVPPSMEREVAAIFEKVVAGGQVALPAAVFPHKNGRTMRVSARVAALRDPTGGICGVGAIFRDVSDERRAWLHQAEVTRLVALDAVADGVAKEIGEIVSALSAGVQAIRTSAIDEGLAQVGGGMARARMLRRDLVAFTSKQELDARPIAVDGLLASRERVLQGSCGPDIKLEMLLGARDAMVFADAGQLGQAILHLVGNARDVMGGSGTVVVETTVEDSCGPAGEQARGEARVCAVIRVTETSRGMDKRAQRQVFEPFVASAPAASGLALAAAYGIIKQSGGRITVESAPGHGTTYSVYLPTNRGPHIRTPPRGSHIFPSEPAS